MKIVRSVAELRAALAEARAAELRLAAVDTAPDRVGVGFVPTMGALHEGHLSLVTAARAARRTVVMSIFVNPTQFDEAADLAAYPRDEARDAALAAAAGVDVLFLPEVGEIYPPGFDTAVSVGGRITEVLEGAERGRAHFDGVATVVSKLLIAAQPDAAYFGEKDYQQVLVVRRLVADLGLPVEIVACPISREADGLARSSRNVRLGPEERRRAAAIPTALAAAQAAATGGERTATRLVAAAAAVLAGERIAPEYLVLADPRTLEPVTRLDGPALLAVAARVGDTRLIDNRILLPGGTERTAER